MKKPIRARTGHVPGGGTCPATGKRIWLTKADAKTIARRTPHGKGLHPYRCHAGDHWHLGHLPPAVVAGDMPRAATRDTTCALFLYNAHGCATLGPG